MTNWQTYASNLLVVSFIGGILALALGYGQYLRLEPLNTSHVTVPIEHQIFRVFVQPATSSDGGPAHMNTYALDGMSAFPHSLD